MLANNKITLFKSDNPIIDGAINILKKISKSHKVSVDAASVFTCTFLALKNPTLAEKNINILLLGGFILAMAQNDKDQGGMAHFENQFLYPYFTLQQLKDLCRDNDPIMQIKTIGEMALDKQLLFNPDRVLRAFPEIEEISKEVATHLKTLANDDYVLYKDLKPR